ncbi:MAG: LytTR family DNA-binding domain-containing protein [Eubacteriales bacterium]|nr:LytTR family DNA-binding domain-containing protein [Eubacteriales bacterium]
MRIAIVDDNPKETAMLLKYMKKHLNETCEFSCFSDGESFLAVWKPQDYDFIILDIFMKELLGIDVAKKIRERDSEVSLVFCTTSNEFASESYEVEAQYYLKKPITEEMVTTMLRKVNRDGMEQALSIILPQGQRVLLQEILYAECAGHIITIFRKEGQPVSARMTQKYLESLLEPYPGFVCCSKGLIINLNAVASLNEQGFLLHDGRIVPVSRRRAKEMKDIYADYLFQILRKKGC